MASELPPPLPPPLPEPRPAGAPPDLPPAFPLTTRLALEGRLHPFTLLFAFWSAARTFLLPMLVVLFFGRRREPDAYIWMGALFLGLPLGWAVIRYFTFTYRIENGELITMQGLLGRTQRNIPLVRVQDIRIEQGVLHRVFGMADVLVETAGGRGPEASLSVLSRREADQLRTAVFDEVQRLSNRHTETLVRPQLIRRLSIRDLVKAGLTSNRAASALALILVLWQFVDDILPQNAYERWVQNIAAQAEVWLSRGGALEWLLILGAALAFIIVGVLFSVVGSIVIFYGFTLSRRGEDIHRTYGLFTRRSSSLPRRRIQLLKIEETWLRRLFRLATLRADTAGGGVQVGQNREEQSGRDVLLPVLPKEDVDAMLPIFFPDLDEGAEQWQKVSRRAIRRGTVKGAAICMLIATISCAVQRTWVGLWPLAFIPLVYMLNVMSYRHLGYWLGERFFRMRSGWLSRATHIVPIRNMQSIIIRQTPFDRGHSVATLIVDSAGQTNTGGGPRIQNVPFSDALDVARTLAHRAAHTRYQC